VSLRARSWYQANTFDHRRFPAELLATQRTQTVSICLPAQNEARTIGPIVRSLLPLIKQGVIDQLVVVDNSLDGTGEIASALGAEVYDQALLMPEIGPVLGKGDAMWRALSVLTGEIICYLDADSEEFGAHYACGLLGPLLTPDAAHRHTFVKGFYRRPFRVGDVTLPEGGGRVTELTARPLLNLFYPDLAAIRQPLAGEVAAQRGLLERLPFVTGYGVDIALLLDAYQAVGLDAIAQVDLDVRQNAHQSLRELGPMAHAVLGVVGARLVRDGRLDGPLPNNFLELGDALPQAVVSQQLERPPLAELRAAA
jgi:glucosyl-3-phosphoglycerate synthase